MKSIARRARPTIAGLMTGALAIAAHGQQRFPAPLTSDSPGKVQVLPMPYPQDWAFLVYAGSKMELIGVSGIGHELKAQLPAFNSATLLVGHFRPEIYVADTLWSRGNRGTRTDFITVFDKQTFQPLGEIVLPGGKRGQIEPMQGMFAFTDEEKLALVFNFTPAASVTVVDLVQRKLLNEIEIPGCTLVYPTGVSGFSTLCASGTVLSVQLDAQGEVTSRAESKPFNRLDTDPLFTTSAVIRGVRYFPSFRGRVQPIDFHGVEPVVLPDWSLVSRDDAAERWQPSGQQLIAGADDGHLYVIMQSDAHEGTHKDPGSEVWVYDVGSRTRVKRIRLRQPAVTIETVAGNNPLLLVATENQLDVYDLPDGHFLRSFEVPIDNEGILIEAAR
ncbi:MAG: amine dehydrogenase large subunit [Gammaproteobacteria bacterium]